MLKIGREICGHLKSAERREWLVSNGIGGFASGTVAGTLTRRYHGLLMGALTPPLGRTLLLAKLDERLEYDGIYPHSGRVYPIHTNQWASRDVDPKGYHHIDSFRLEGSVPVWTYAVANALLEKRIWMQHGANTTYIQYKLIRATGPMNMEIKAFANYRDYHNTTIVNDWVQEVDDVAHGLKIKIHDDAEPFYLLTPHAAELEPRSDWYEDFFLSLEEYRGQRDVQEDHLYVAKVHTLLRPGDTFTLVATTDPNASLDDIAGLQARHEREAKLISQAKKVLGDVLPAPIEQLVLAADQFVVRRPTEKDDNGRSLLAGYHWFSDWGRDTMIALPGITLTTGRPHVAASILRTYAQFVDQGMIPNRFPDIGQAPEYNTVDATLWYFEAIRAYCEATQDDDLLKKLFPVLQNIIMWHKRGTRYNIHVDQTDGLLYAGEEGVQLTWMDAKVGDWVVTHRIGKPVEINALWYNALNIMSQFAKTLGKAHEEYTQLAEKAATGFAKFWNAEMGYCYDVIDGPDGPDSKLRPNQLFAISLPYSPLTREQQRSALDACARHLVVAHGLRSLSPDDQEYIGIYEGDTKKRDGAYHQGTAWSWLIGPFVQAHLRVYQNPTEALTFLDPLFLHLMDHGIGSISEIFDGDAPFTPRGCIAQAWSVAEVLRAWRSIQGAME